MRITVDFLVLGIIGAVAGWAARAPAEPQARAAYLCAPLATLTNTVSRIEALVAREEPIVPPQSRWPQPGLQDQCAQWVAALSADAGT